MREVDGWETADCEMLVVVGLSDLFVSKFEFEYQTYFVILFIYFIESLSHFALNFVSC